MDIKINIEKQKLYLKKEPYEGPYIVSDSVKYLRCIFKFSDDWKDFAKTVIFKDDVGNAYSILLEGDTCIVPYEVLTGNKFAISAFGTYDGVRITTNEITVPIIASGYAEGKNPAKPVPTAYELILDKLRQIGTLLRLKTNNKETLVDAINEVVDTKADKTELIGKNTENGGAIFGNPNNKALTKNSVVLGGGDDDAEDYNIAGQLGYLICGVYTDDENGIYKFIIEDENCMRPPVGANIKYAIPFGETTSWTENGVGKITNVEDYNESDYSEFVSIESETGYFLITLESKPDLTREHLDKDYGSDVRTSRIACKMWSPDYPEYGNYQIAYSATAIGKRTRALGDSSFAFGKGSKATGAYALAGSGEASGTSSVTLAGATKASGERAVAIGPYSEANEDYTITLGLRSKANKPYTTLIGSDLESTNSETDNSSIILGAYNDPDTSEFLTVGIGKSYGKRINGLTLDREGNLTIAGDMSCENLYINSYKFGNEGEIGWFKFASYEFVEGGYPRSEALLYISNYNVGTKFMSLVEITIDQIPDGYHSTQGIVFTQIAGTDITKNLAYYVDPDTNNITFYIKKEKFQVINVSNLRSVGSFSRNLINIDIDKVCLDTIDITDRASFATISIDTKMSDTSENPVQNKVVKEYVDNITLYDIDFTTNGKALADYAGQTISNKCIRLTTSTLTRDNYDGSTITFNNCKIYGFNKHLSIQYGQIIFKNCEVYDLSLSVYPADEDGNYGQFSYTNTNFYNCKFYDYYDSAFGGCILNNCYVYCGYLYSENTKYINCDFELAGFQEFSNSEYVIFDSCKMPEYACIYHSAYFTGCTGTVNISSSVDFKPSTTTAFTDHNFATLVIN